MPRARFPSLIIVTISLRWAPSVTVRLFHGDSKADRRAQLQRVSKRGGVLITTYVDEYEVDSLINRDNMLRYNMVTNNVAELSAVQWDYIVADEGHKLKNHNIKAAQALRQLPVAHRLLLTGTPIQACRARARVLQLQLIASLRRWQSAARVRSRDHAHTRARRTTLGSCGLCSTLCSLACWVTSGASTGAHTANTSA